ncbi:MAG: choice-of-anchor A family protein [Methylomonas sp.]|nr:choice-of-anchor A family protein [Methylomonas sp.]
MWLVVATVFCSPAQAAWISLGQAEPFNAVVLGNMTAYGSDTEGRLAVGGHASFEHYSVGMELGSGWNHRDTLVVGGNLDFAHGRIYHGNANVGGNVQINETLGFYDENPAVTNGSLLRSPAIDFASLGLELIQKSQTWANLATNGQVGWQHNLLTLTGFQSGLNVFSITGNQLSATQKLTIDIPDNSWALVNVDGRLASMSEFAFFRRIAGEDIQVPDNSPANRHDGRWTQTVLFNLFEAEDLTLHSIAIKASLLAPFADTVFYNGHIDGQLMVASLSSPVGQFSGQINLYPFTPVPLPGMAPLFVVLLGLWRWKQMLRLRLA